MTGRLARCTPIRSHQNTKSSSSPTCTPTVQPTPSFAFFPPWQLCPYVSSVLIVPEYQVRQPNSRSHVGHAPPGGNVMGQPTASLCGSRPSRTYSIKHNQPVISRDPTFTLVFLLNLPSFPSTVEAFWRRRFAGTPKSKTAPLLPLTTGFSCISPVPRWSQKRHSLFRLRQNS